MYVGNYYNGEEVMLISPVSPKMVLPQSCRFVFLTRANNPILSLLAIPGHVGLVVMFTSTEVHMFVTGWRPKDCL